MQLSAPEAFDLKSESAATLEQYGLNQPTTEDFGRRCLLARRLVERGVRFVQVWSGPKEQRITGIIMEVSWRIATDCRQCRFTHRRVIGRSYINVG
jgi:hypothetical protein